MKTINIKGKSYVTVNERLKAFRENFKGYSLLTEIVEMNETACTIKASILNDKREVVATGYAREVVGKTPINKFAFVENAETSAWGRALGNFGIGIDEAICTAEELGFKLEQEKAPKAEKAEPSISPKHLKMLQSAKTVEELDGTMDLIKTESGDAFAEVRGLYVPFYKKRKAELAK